MGATNPANAEEGTIRKKFARSIQENAIHGSDARRDGRLRNRLLVRRLRADLDEPGALEGASSNEHKR